MDYFLKFYILDSNFRPVVELGCAGFSVKMAWKLNYQFLIFSIGKMKNYDHALESSKVPNQGKTE